MAYSFNLDNVAYTLDAAELERRFTALSTATEETHFVNQDLTVTAKGCFWQILSCFCCCCCSCCCYSDEKIKKEKQAAQSAIVQLRAQIDPKKTPALAATFLAGAYRFRLEYCDTPIDRIPPAQLRNMQRTLGMEQLPPHRIAWEDRTIAWEDEDIGL